MSESITNSHLLREARAGSSDALGQLLQLYENYLRVLLLAQFQSRLKARVSPSDVLQETFYEAHRDFSQFRGLTIPEFLTWIRKILIHNLKRCIDQHVHAARRDVRREIGVDDLAASLEHSAARLDAIVADQASSPTMRVEREEIRVAMTNFIAALPDDYRDVIVLRHFRGLSFEEIGKEMDRSSGATRMLWLRAIKQLQARFNA